MEFMLMEILEVEKVVWMYDSFSAEPCGFGSPFCVCKRRCKLWTSRVEQPTYIMGIGRGILFTQPERRRRIEVHPSTHL
jgi:hypothetical protein